MCVLAFYLAATFFPLASSLYPHPCVPDERCERRAILSRMKKKETELPYTARLCKYRSGKQIDLRSRKFPRESASLVSRLVERGKISSAKIFGCKFFPARGGSWNSFGDTRNPTKNVVSDRRISRSCGLFRRYIISPSYQVLRVENAAIPVHG